MAQIQFQLRQKLHLTAFPIEQAGSISSTSSAKALQLVILKQLDKRMQLPGTEQAERAVQPNNPKPGPPMPTPPEHCLAAVRVSRYIYFVIEGNVCTHTVRVTQLPYMRRLLQTAAILSRTLHSDCLVERLGSCKRNQRACETPVYEADFTSLDKALATPAAAWTGA